MVQKGDLQVSLVDATTKVAFKEHKKDGDVYIEVEPDAEYFIGIRKTKVTSDALCCVFFVDGKDLEYYHPFEGPEVNRAFLYNGLFSRKDGIPTDKALKFTKPKYSAGNYDPSTNNLPGMGQVQVKVYKGIPEGESVPPDCDESSFSPASVSQSGGIASQKKCLRSDEGSTTNTCAPEVERSTDYSRGDHLYTITLNYCAAVGLIKVGVLPKPDMWAHHRMVRPGKKNGVVKPIELFDLTGGVEDLVSDEDDDSSGDDSDLEDLNLLAYSKKRKASS